MARVFLFALWVASLPVAATFTASPLAARRSSGSAHVTARMMCTPELMQPEIPFGLEIVGSGVTGVVTEIFPQLRERFTADELDTIAENTMSCIGDYWRMPQCGSALWVLYKRVCDKDLDKLAKALMPENAAESRKQIRGHL